MLKEELHYPSNSGQNEIFATSWQPETDPLAILQISHGMAEFIERYQNFAEFLAKQGFFVVGNDHLGHGRSAGHPNNYGYFSDGNSKEHIVEDIKALHDLVKADYPTLPYFLMGHSMGSFIVRNYLQKYGDSVDGAILMGTSGPKPELEFLLPLLKVLNRVAPHKRNPLVDQLAFGKFKTYFVEGDSDFNWLSKNQENVKWYENHHQTGFIFTNNGFLTLFSLLNAGTKAGWAKTIPKKLPILVISGEDDPVGDMGKGIRKVFHELEEMQFSDITFCSYPEMRHEILMEENASLVYADILDWLSRHLPQ
ncbi:alpha/beta hydrolase [Carnobacterium gallinarum]|uniref:alpha/beta hydrolase n=1 Tax=Carnobacterium gallinarum TaxID=2749 RepID=UPI0009FC5952|nr:alpha/beta hydrolase [Carnobacterium gallinarum]